MEAEGEGVMRPFLQDVLRVDGLILTIGGLMLRKPIVTFQILASVGPQPILDWFAHFSAMVAYTALHAAAAPLLPPSADGPLDAALPPRTAYALRRTAEAWQYGSGLDYVSVPSTVVPPEALAKAKAAAAAARARAAARSPARRVEAAVVE